MRVDGAHPLSVMVVAVSPRVRMVLRVGRCVEFMGVWLSGHFGQCITLLYRVWVVAWPICCDEGEYDGQILSPINVYWWFGFCCWLGVEFMRCF